MAADDIALRFHYPASTATNDMRTVLIKQVATVDGTETETDLYKFYHPVLAGLNTGVTSYHRRNLSSGVWEPAGQIDWSSQSTAVVFFGGTDRVHVRELRKGKKATSKSRRFKASGNEYKWKVAENGQDLLCLSQQLTTYGKNIADWCQESLTLRVAARAEPILDHVVVTLFLNLWMKAIDMW